ncbi:MAG: mannose-1-phosphate guanylyltransferase [Thermoplasmatota archaeon]
MKAIVLAGGSGERFWPMSTPETPKQFLKLFGDLTLIEETCHRLLQRFDPGDILIITSADHVERTKELVPDLPGENIIGEPLRRNTAPACALGALLSGTDEIDLVVPADHHIPDPEPFWEAFDRCVSSIPRTDGLYTFGIRPTRPDTGYGYIEAGDELGNGLFSVSRFTEKPDLRTAKDFLEGGAHLWNSGMFVWKASTFLSELQKCSEEIFDVLVKIDPRDPAALAEAYSRLPAKSVDYAVMERSSRVLMVEADFAWSDVGNWSSIVELEGYCRGSDEFILRDSKNIFIRSTTGRPVGIIGLEGVVVIDTKNGLLVCSEEKVQEVREVTKAIKERERS